MTGGQLARVREVVIDAKSAFPKIAAIFAAAPIELLKARQAFGVADQAVYLLNSELAAAADEFRGNALGNGAFMGGAPRNIRAEKTSEMVIGDIVSGLYVAKYSSPRVKTIAQAMAENMRQALDAHLQALSWMGPASRAKAREKLARMHILIGYPEHFDDYAGLEIDDHDLYGNYVRSAAYQWQVLVHRLGRPYDQSQWSVRAEYPTFSYTPTSNTVEIPAALLVPPFFDVAADPAVNYGSAGTIIGAMIASPFFMQQGLNFDTDGHLNPWLARDEAARFSEIGRLIADQYSRVEQIPGFPLKGELLADEALGDLAGLEISLDAYHLSLRGTSAPQLDGYSGDQRFFSRPRLHVAGEIRRVLRSKPDRNRLESTALHARQRAFSQYGQMVFRVRCEARRQTLYRAGTARENLVTGKGDKQPLSMGGLNRSLIVFGALNRNGYGDSNINGYWRRPLAESESSRRRHTNDDEGKDPLLGKTAGGSDDSVQPGSSPAPIRRRRGPPRPSPEATGSTISISRSEAGRSTSSTSRTASRDRTNGSISTGPRSREKSGTVAPTSMNSRATAPRRVISKA